MALKTFGSKGTFMEASENMNAANANFVRVMDETRKQLSTLNNFRANMNTEEYAIYQRVNTEFQSLLFKVQTRYRNTKQVR